MHTSTDLRAEHFSYARCDGGEETAIAFDAMFPDYHPQDRVAVACERIDDGPLCTAGALLALTTAYYDCLRARGKPFFSYPQHFCLLAADDRGVRTSAIAPPLDPADIGKCWGPLDVWPACKWKTAAPTRADLLRLAFDLQINRLFWPARYAASNCGAPMPGYAADILATDLKQVWYYRSDRPSHAIRAEGPAVGFIRSSIEALPLQVAREPGDPSPNGSRVERFEQVPVAAFLQQHAALFDQ